MPKKARWSAGLRRMGKEEKGREGEKTGGRGTFIEHFYPRICAVIKTPVEEDLDL